ncbi:hypothetical protein MCOR27_004670 [Pyricularia oryzae]|uniref:Trafficking protein particle complex II-specific subunit 65 IgD3 domain-containing protein n=2 Tax=Pyricularia TaxID=48558 RepID=A0ABQ8NN51_PYRGI|nr:hypothetical protein MCOR01_011075 [Pyricularia oryzae]KAI6299077.1 hypothetical protein MCOR33_004944 [Pyricularia grisea]KAI6261974.1 hypothetical protein MCOR19_001788 [Pyricularia oryzae]KAI6280084.1 hypothetical protein MCOR26_003889 [Pyricularia oryzae]KAI6280424.1 hypothetical protein MCOR27_004670 [Pyricularia oryzae]
MAGLEDDDPSTIDSEFIEKSHLTYAVPLSSSPDLAEVLKQSSSKGSTSSSFKSLEQREFLFFDESIHVYLILRTPRCDEEYLRPLLARISLSLEAYVVNSNALDRDHSPPASEIIFSDDAVERTLEAAKADNASESERGDNLPVILHDESEEEAKERYSFAIWKVPVLISRPRIRLQSPTIVFAAAAHLRAHVTADENGADVEDSDGGIVRNGYLQSRAPVGLNLLEPFAHDPALHGFKPRLSAQRVSLVVPVTQSKDFRQPIRSLQNLSFRVVAAVHTRVKFARPNALPASSTVIAMLELDFTPYFDCETVLTNISLNLPSGVVTDMNSDSGLKLPLSCVAHDHVTFLYRLAPTEHDQLLEGAPVAVTVPGTPRASMAPAARDLDISIEVKALIRPGECTPRLKMAWSTPVDFTPPVNPGFGASSMAPPLQRAHRPSQLSIDGAASMVNPAVARPDSLPGLEAATQRNVETTIPDFGITITFSGPKKPARVGEEFCWSVFVVNRSGTSALPISNAPPVSRKLALRVIPKRRRTNDVRVVRPPTRRQQPAAAKGKKDPAAREQELIADAVVDENMVHAMHRSSLVEGYDVLCLSADARVGPLAPGACHVVDLRFVALRAGTLAIEAVRVVDMVSQEHVDVRELPTIHVEPDLAES